MKYFAYGSNLSLRQMRERCPQARRLCSARLPNWTLLFTGGSRSQSGGTATIRLQQGQQVLGGVYEIDAACLRSLDTHEGYPSVYDRMNVIVFNDLGDAIEAVTYFKKGRAVEAAPSQSYLAIIREGYRDWGLL
jgi:gamma-glutamylcyclotransferase